MQHPHAAGAQAGDDAFGEHARRARAAAQQDAGEVEVVVAQQRADVAQAPGADVQQARDLDGARARDHQAAASDSAAARSASSSISTQAPGAIAHTCHGTPSAAVRPTAPSYHSPVASLRPTNPSSTARRCRSTGPRAISIPMYSPAGSTMS